MDETCKRCGRAGCPTRQDRSALAAVDMDAAIRQNRAARRDCRKHHVDWHARYLAEKAAREQAIASAVATVRAEVGKHWKAVCDGGVAHPAGWDAGIKYLDACARDTEQAAKGTNDG